MISASSHSSQALSSRMRKAVESRSDSALMFLFHSGAHENCLASVHLKSERADSISGTPAACAPRAHRWITKKIWVLFTLLVYKKILNDGIEDKHDSIHKSSSTPASGEIKQVMVALMCKETFFACVVEASLLLLHIPFSIMNPHDPPKRRSEILHRLAFSFSRGNVREDERSCASFPAADTERLNHGESSTHPCVTKVLQWTDECIDELLCKAETTAQDSGSRQRSTDALLREVVEATAERVLVSSLHSAVSAVPSPIDKGMDDKDSLAYIIFTSGSTGKGPKGVLASRGNLVSYYDDFCCHPTKGLGLSPGETKASPPCFLTLTTPFFDPSIGDMLCTVLSMAFPEDHGGDPLKANGAVQVCIPSAYLLEPQGLNSVVKHLLQEQSSPSERIQAAYSLKDGPLTTLPRPTHVISTPAVWQLLSAETSLALTKRHHARDREARNHSEANGAENGRLNVIENQNVQEEPLAALRVFLGGERMSAKIIDRWASVASLHSIYGVTEATIYQSVSLRIVPGTHVRDITCGCGTENLRIRIEPLDDHPASRSEGDATQASSRHSDHSYGEVVLEGPQVALGYLPHAHGSANEPREPSFLDEKQRHSQVGSGRFTLSPDGMRCFSTGDIGALISLSCERGDAYGLHLIGRRDFQVKLNGQRVSLEKVESELFSLCRNVFHCCCCCALPISEARFLRQMRDEEVPAEGAVVLGVYAMLSHTTALDSLDSGTDGYEDLLERLGPLWEGLATEVLPLHMRPHFWLVEPRSKLSTTSNAAFTPTGKLNRSEIAQKLAVYWWKRKELQNYVRSSSAETANRTKVTKLYHTVQLVWKKFFGLPESSPLLPSHTHFYHLGGDSLGALKLTRAVFLALGGQESEIDALGYLPSPFEPYVLLQHPRLGDYIHALEQGSYPLSVLTNPGNEVPEACISHAPETKKSTTSGLEDALENHPLVKLADDTFQAVLQLGNPELVSLVLSEGLFSTRVKERIKTPCPNWLHTVVNLYHEAFTCEASQQHSSNSTDDKALDRFSEGYNRILGLLVQHGCKVTATTPDGVTPAHLAAAGASSSTLALLLAAGTPLTVRDRRGQTLLHFAARAGNVDAVRLLIRQWKHSASHPSNDPALPEAEEGKGKEDLTPALLKRRKTEQRNVKSVLCDRDKWQRTPAHWAVLNGHIEVLVLMLDCLEDEKEQKENQEGSAIECDTTSLKGKRQPRKKVLSVKEHFSRQAKKKTHLAYETLVELATRVVTEQRSSICETSVEGNWLPKANEGTKDALLSLCNRLSFWIETVE